MITIELPGEYLVTIRTSANGSAPDRQGGMSTQSSTLWVKLVRPNWDSGWHQCHDKSLTKVVRLWKLVASEADIPEAWRESTGQRVCHLPRGVTESDVLRARVAELEELLRDARESLATAHVALFGLRVEVDRRDAECGRVWFVPDGSPDRVCHLPRGHAPAARYGCQGEPPEEEDER